MFRFKNYIAIVLLLLFVRVLVPEATVLALHTHEHTDDVHKKTDYGLKLDKKHSHCQTENLFNTPYSPAFFQKLNLLSPVFNGTYTYANSFAWQFTFPNNIDLRGPPRV